MKKLIMMFLVLASVSFAVDDEYEVIKVEGDTITVKNLTTEEISVIQKTQASDYGVTISITSPTTVTISESFADTMMPGSSQGSGEAGDTGAAGDAGTGGDTGTASGTTPSAPITPVIPPMDVIAGTVTEAYGAK